MKQINPSDVDAGRHPVDVDPRQGRPGEPRPLTADLPAGAKPAGDGHGYVIPPRLF